MGSRGSLARAGNDFKCQPVKSAGVIVVSRFSTGRQARALWILGGAGRLRGARGNSVCMEQPAKASRSAAPAELGTRGTREPLSGVVRNPILPGFHPDPSVCRAGDDYYLVTSSFEYFPGVPLFHSRNLSEWDLIGHVLTRENQLPLAGAKSSQGIFAPTLRFHQGTFVMITTNMTTERGFYVTTEDPTRAWSDPIFVQEEGFTMDPSLFFDDDGKVYYTRHGGGRHGAVYQAEIDLATGRLAQPARPIWTGTGGIWPEGPHLYKINGSYYLMIAEGGTSYDHEVTIARSDSPWGPFEACPRNPIFTHKHDRKLAIQATGHADLLQSQDGAWWLVFLGIRPWDGTHHHLGRETCLAPVTWDDAGWPVVNHGRPVELLANVPSLPGKETREPVVYGSSAIKDDFDAPALAPAWNFLRNPDPNQTSLSARPGWLRLNAAAATLDDEACVSFVGRRQLHYACRARLAFEFAPVALGQEAGLVVRADELNHYELVVTYTICGPELVLKSRVQGKSSSVAARAWSTQSAELSVEASPSHYEFFVHAAGAREFLGRLPTQALASEVTGGFTGAYLGMFACGGPGTPPADFDYFEYTPLEAAK